MFNCRFDYHVHMGQFQNVYYNPYKVVDVLLKCGIKGAFVSSTTSCIKWNTQEEKEIVIEHIKAEVNELLSYSKKRNFDAKPICWVIPQRYYDGETVEEMFLESDYYGFKIHPRAHDWNLSDNMIVQLLSDICRIAQAENIPIVVHTGICEFEKSSKFEYWFRTFPNVKFILAHCKDVDETLELLNIYKNLYVDVAFSSPKDLRKILNSNQRTRLLFGTDFPITAHCQNMNSYKEKALYTNYKKILSTWHKYLNEL